MRLTREKIIRLSHQITEVLVASNDVEFVDDRDTIRQQVVKILTDTLREEEKADLEVRLGCKVKRLFVRETDYVKDTTIVDVRPDHRRVLRLGAEREGSQTSFEGLREDRRGPRAVPLLRRTQRSPFRDAHARRPGRFLCSSRCWPWECPFSIRFFRCSAVRWSGVPSSRPIADTCIIDC